MKEKLWFRKYRSECIMFCIFLVILSGLLCLSLVAGQIFFCFASMFSMFIVGCFALHDLYCLISYKKRTIDMTPCVGKISNWKVTGGRHVYWGCVVLEHEGVQYCSPSYFNAQTAEEMVGKEVLYTVIDETLLIYEILK